MKVIFHCGYDGAPVESIYDDCFLDNRQEPVVRIGGEPFKSCYDIEWGCSRLHIIDPSRSLAAPILEILDWDNGEPNWMTYDCLSRLIADMGINRFSQTEYLRFCQIATCMTAVSMQSMRT